MALGGAIDPIVPVAAPRRLLLWLRKTILNVSRGALRWCGKRSAYDEAGDDRRSEFRNSVCHMQLRRQYGTLYVPNLDKKLGRNEPQFRRRWGLIRARTGLDEAQKRPIIMQIILLLR